MFDASISFIFDRYCCNVIESKYILCTKFFSDINSYIVSKKNEIEKYQTNFINFFDNDVSQYKKY